MSLPYAPHCTNGQGIRQSHLSEGVIISPDGRPISYMCKPCAQVVINEYKEKLNVTWTFEEREFETVNYQREVYPKGEVEHKISKIIVISQSKSKVKQGLSLEDI